VVHISVTYTNPWPVVFLANGKAIIRLFEDHGQRDDFFSSPAVFFQSITFLEDFFPVYKMFFLS